jgi:hypothetical protein
MTRGLAAGVMAWAMAGTPLMAQQLPDRDYRPPVSAPAWPAGQGPRVCVDEGHNNFHTLGDRFWAFGELLRRDGYQTVPLPGPLRRETLDPCRVLVISNAQLATGEWDTYPYPTPSGFTPAEIEATHDWVGRGGSLLLIADHMPLAGVAAGLAARFGVTFTDGFAFEGVDAATGDPRTPPTIFRTADGTLRDHPIVRGRTPAESVSSVRTFTGQAFRAPDTAAPLLVLPAAFVVLMPERPWEFGPKTRRLPAGGWLQGAAITVGKGRAAFFGEAAMFTAQVAGPDREPMGMNAPGAEQNFQFVLNVVRWLAGRIA